MEMLIGRNVP